MMKVMSASSVAKSKLVYNSPWAQNMTSLKGILSKTKLYFSYHYNRDSLVFVLYFSCIHDNKHM